MQAVSNPRVTFNIVASENRVGPDDVRALVIGQMTTGTAEAGVVNTDVPRNDADINALVGEDSHVGMILRAYREINKVTNVDVIPLADAGTSTAATAVIAFSGTATKDASVFVNIVSKSKHRYQLDVSSGDTAATIASKLKASIDADRNLPFTNARTSGSVTCTAANTGTHANDWLLSYEGTIPGVTVALTGWTGGATNPSLTTLWDTIQNIRYQTIIFPAKWDRSKLATLLNARKNVANNVMDGMGFVYDNTSFATVKTTAHDLNSSEVVMMTNEPISSANRYIGPHVPDAPDVIAAKVAAALDLRFEDGAPISDIVATNAPNDQFGGMHTASLPAFNTPIIGVGLPPKGTGYTGEEQLELEDAGVSVVGVNRTWNNVITGVMVTTWLNDVAGNADDTWKYLEWRRTHGMIREYFQRNCQKEFRQHRMTTGVAVPNFAIIDEPAIRSFCLLLYQELALQVITVAGIKARKFFEDNLSVTMFPGQRRISIAAKTPMVSQLGEIIGTIEYTFETA
jgi:phage tail sheath gpL-like